MQICNFIAERFRCEWIYEKKYKAFTTSLILNEHDIILLKSKWPMNINGKSISKIGNFLIINVFYDYYFIFKNPCLFTQYDMK